jgi:hypothetical protein
MSQIKSFITALLLCLVAGCNPSTSDPVGNKPIKETAEFKKAQSDSTSRLSARINWNQDIRSGAYDRIGRRNPQWDAQAHLALDLMSQGIANPKIFTPETHGQIQEALSAAIAAGCDDSLVVYAYNKFVLSYKDIPAQKFADAYVANYNAMEASEYGEMVKFYCALRTALAQRAVVGTNTNPILGETLTRSAQHLWEIAQDRKTPIEDIYLSMDELMTAVSNNATDYEGCYPAFEPFLFQNWPKAAECYLLKGKYYDRHAWHGRGGGYADGITEDRWKLFFERSREAEKALLSAWKLNPGLPEIAEQMIRVTVSLQQPREKMELWFKRAMELDPDDLRACKNKLWYLNPKWYGSDTEMLKFGRECVASSKWKGNVPLALVDAHTDLVNLLPDENARKQYWRQPEVWPDVKAAYEKFFELNPKAIDLRANYAWFAFLCEQWDAFNQQVELMNPVNYAFFGGKEKFEKLVETSKRNSEKK